MKKPSLWAQTTTPLTKRLRQQLQEQQCRPQPHRQLFLRSRCHPSVIVAQATAVDRAAASGVAVWRVGAAGHHRLQ
jgi:hypothetical protein